MRTVAFTILTFLAACNSSGSTARDDMSDGRAGAPSNSSGSTAEDDISDKRAGAPSETGRYYQWDLARSVKGAEVHFGTVPKTHRLGDPPVSIKVAYRNAPAGAGILVSIARDVPFDQLRDEPESGGGLYEAPIPVEGSGTIMIKLDKTFLSTACDTNRPALLKTGGHILLASMVNYRDVDFTMIEVPGRMDLAQSLTSPIMLVK